MHLVCNKKTLFKVIKCYKTFLQPYPKNLDWYIIKFNKNRNIKKLKLFTILIRNYNMNFNIFKRFYKSNKVI